MKVALIYGTWGRQPGHEGWWRAGSPFAQALARQGHVLALPSFQWSTEIDGLIGPDLDWTDAAEKLVLYLKVYPAEAIVAHSHAGQVVALACAQGATLARLVTVGTPVRREPELEAAYAATRAATGRWTHVHSDRADLWQYRGSLALSDLLRPWRLWTVPRAMPLAHVNVATAGRSHGALLDPAWWTAEDLWTRGLG